MTTDASRPFPTDFLWGVATAGHQNEGNNTTSDTWFLENVSPTIFAELGEEIRDRKRAEVYDHWLRPAADDDFIGVQNYERITYGPQGAIPARAGTVLNEMGTAVDPASLGGTVGYAHQVSGRPVLVTEHGVGTADDAVRVGFIEPTLAGLLDAMDDGGPVLGYFHWTLLDNFEWILGYSKHFGLHEVNRETFVRTPKPSAAAYGRIARARAVVVSP
jgi:beta-glucosidase